MKFIRIKSYLDDKLVCEQLYLTDSQVKAIKRFRKDYPTHKNCIVVAENYESDEHKEHYEVCKRCGCVNLIK